MPYFGLQNKPKNANYASSAFFRKIMKIVLVMANYAKNCASTICQSLVPRTFTAYGKSPYALATYGKTKYGSEPQWAKRNSALTTYGKMENKARYQIIIPVYLETHCISESYRN